MKKEHLNARITIGHSKVALVYYPTIFYTDEFAYECVHKAEEIL
jgi:hypothetical protein